MKFFNWTKKENTQVKTPASLPPTTNQIIQKIQQNANPQTAQKTAAFHKTNDIESNAAPDIFLGVAKTISKQIASEYANKTTFEDISQLLKRNEHEIKLVALLILIEKTNQSPQLAKQSYDFYFKHLNTITSWDLADETAPVIIGNYLQKRPHFPREDLYALAKSRSDWDKRIAITATKTFIENNDFEDALKICQLYFSEISPMVQKTAGKILKEIGRQNKHVLIEFLAHNQTKIPKDMLNAALSDLPATFKKTIRSEKRILQNKHL